MKEKELKVRITYEPNRLWHINLEQAYDEIMSVSLKGKETKAEEETQVEAKVEINTV